MATVRNETESSREGKKDRLRRLHEQMTRLHDRMMRQMMRMNDQVMGDMMRMHRGGPGQMGGRGSMGGGR